MAREYAQVKLSIWADDDWRDLSPLARYLYLTLLTSPTLSHCGVADWRPGRIAAINGMSTAQVEDVGDELADALYLVIDNDTEEALIRSFIRHDGVMKQPKMAVAVASAHAAVASTAIRGVLIHELQRLREDSPDLSGWGSEKASALLNLRSLDPSTYPSGKGKRTPIAKGSGKGCPTPAPAPASLQTSPADAENVAAATPPRPEVAALCTLLADLIEANGSKRPHIGKGWTDAARLMLDRDERDPTEAESLIRWCQASEFWRPNILSMPTFREKYDRLRLQSQAKQDSKTSYRASRSHLPEAFQ